MTRRPTVTGRTSPCRATAAALTGPMAPLTMRFYVMATTNSGARGPAGSTMTGLITRLFVSLPYGGWVRVHRRDSLEALQDT
jgi:hypothetical protein